MRLHLIPKSNERVGRGTTQLAEEKRLKQKIKGFLQFCPKADSRRLCGRTKWIGSLMGQGTCWCCTTGHPEDTITTGTTEGIWGEHFPWYFYLSAEWRFSRVSTCTGTCKGNFSRHNNLISHNKSRQELLKGSPTWYFVGSDGCIFACAPSEGGQVNPSG